MSLTVFTRCRICLMALSVAVGSLAGATLQAQVIPVSNASFETPTPPPGFPATPQIDSWNKFPQPQGLPLPGGVTWEQMSGVFPNTAPGASDHIDNVHGNQAAYLFSVPGVGVYQDLSATFTAGQAYNLSLGLIAGGGMQPGSSLLFGLYYRDSANNPVPVGSTIVSYSSAAFPNATHFNDYQLDLAAVQAGDAWAGKNIGVQIVSTAGMFDGYWDLDNLRLQVVPEPGTLPLVAPALGLFLWIRRRGAHH
jgi:hypothetical protein